MKASHICPKCNSHRVGRFDRGTTTRHTLGGVELDADVYVCAGCGYFEEYVARADKVTWDLFDNFTWLND